MHRAVADDGENVGENGGRERERTHRWLRVCVCVNVRLRPWLFNDCVHTCAKHITVPVPPWATRSCRHDYGFCPIGNRRFWTERCTKLVRLNGNSSSRGTTHGPHQQLAVGNNWRTFEWRVHQVGCDRRKRYIIWFNCSINAEVTIPFRANMSHIQFMEFTDRVKLFRFSLIWRHDQYRNCSHMVFPPFPQREKLQG